VTASTNSAAPPANVHCVCPVPGDGLWVVSCGAATHHWRRTHTRRCSYPWAVTGDNRTGYSCVVGDLEGDTPDRLYRQGDLLVQCRTCVLSQKAERPHGVRTETVVPCR
jgi:hypothetical protein